LKTKNYITPPGFQKLRSELAQLLNVERPKVVETVAWAASNGDRSENADYIYGKRRLREIDSRVRFLTGRIENAEVVDPGLIQSVQVKFGARITVETEDGEMRTYQIVGEDEWNIDAGMVSWKSPLASALLGKMKGDEVTLKKPSGEESLLIIKIEYRSF